MFHLPTMSQSNKRVVGALWSFFPRHLLHRIATLAILLVTILVSQGICLEQGSGVRANPQAAKMENRLGSTLPERMSEHARSVLETGAI